MKIMLLAGLLLFLGVIWVRNTQAADAPGVGQMAPDFALGDQAGIVRKLADYRGKWLVIYFYPKDESPYCTTEACQYRDDIIKINRLGAAVLGVSVDDQDSHAEFASKHHLPFPLLADKGGALAARYGSIVDLFVIRFARRNTFIIDPEGRIAKVYLSVNAATNPGQVVADLAAMQAARR